MTVSHERQSSGRGRTSSSDMSRTDIVSIDITYTPTSDDGYRATSHVSGHSAFEPELAAAIEDTQPYHEAGDEVFNRLSRTCKTAIVMGLSFGAFPTPISSRSVLAATPEVTSDHNTTGSIINVSNAAYMIVMALSPVILGPISQVFGRRVVALASSVMFFFLGLATALAPDLATFIVFWAASAFTFVFIGPACICDIYQQSTGLSGAGALSVYFVVPEPALHLKIKELESFPGKKKVRAILSMISPMRVLRPFQYWNITLVAGGSASLTWDVDSLSTPVRSVLNPRFNLKTSLLSGGQWADYTAKQGIKKLGGAGIPDDRLWSTLPFIGVIIPGSMVIYG
ncbi:dityrosine transporter [Fusarium albosuccineum]|uniref:Dityrosine transporter n=1 Tax=Fusarium albosuccineum TaxID=1237068 RepID=A0A8H4LJ90_9HYPO|nr:dityrosine transporter [Fusarium albosuccineum]